MDKKQYHKVIYTVDPATRRIKISFKPELDYKNVENIQTFLNTIYTGTYMSLKTVLAAMPMLRPATPEEREAKVYIFKNQDADNRLYKERKEMYDNFANGFNTILREMFPDIEYIENSRTEEQHRVFDMSNEEAEERRLEIEQLTEKIRNTPESELVGDHDGDIPKGGN